MNRLVILFFLVSFLSFSLVAEAEIKKCGKAELELCRAASDCYKCLCKADYVAGKLSSCKKEPDKCVNDCVKKRGMSGENRHVNKCDDPINTDKSVVIVSKEGEVEKKTQVETEGK
jgi:hypothetical protein